MRKWFVCAGLLVFSVSLQAQTIAQWTFETSLTSAFGSAAAAGTALTPSVAPETGSGSAFGFHSGISYYTSPAGNGSARSLSATNWAIGDYYQFSTSTVGYNNISLDYDQISSNTGPGKFGLFYSTDGSTWTQFGSDYTVIPNASPNAWSSTVYSSASHFSFDLSAVTELNNAGNVYFQLRDTSTTSANLGTVAGGGTDRVDNFTVSVVPEPATGALVGLGLAGLFIRRKTR